MISTALVLKGAYSGSTCITSHKRTPDEVPWLPLFLSWKEKQTNDIYECKFIIKRKKIIKYWLKMNVFMLMCTCFWMKWCESKFFLRMISTRYPSIQTLLFADWSWVGSYSHCESVWPYSSCWKNPTKRKWTNKCNQSQDGS